MILFIERGGVKINVKEKARFFKLKVEKSRKK